MVASSSLSAFGCFASFSTRAVRILSSHHGRSTPFTSVLDICSLRASSSMGTVMSTYSRSHEIGTLINTDFPRREGVLREHGRGPPGAGAPGRVATGGEPAEGPRPGGPRREQRVSDVRARHGAPLELLQVSQVVLIKEPDVGRAGTEHRKALDTAAEGEALILRGVVADAAQDIRVDHPAARGFDPAVATADVAVWIAALAGEAVERDLRRWLRERKVVDPKTDLAVASEDLSRERIQRPLEVGHRELLVDREALVLEEDRLADRVGRLVAVAATGNDDAYRRLPLLHHSHLHRRRVGPAEDRTRWIVPKWIRDPERVPFLAGGMAGRDIEGFEVVVVPLDLGTLDRLEAERPEYPGDFADRLGYRVQATDANATRRKRHVLALSPEIALQRLRSERPAALVESRLDATLGLIQRRAVCGLLCRGKLRDALRGLAQGALPSEVLHPGGLEGGLVRGGADLSDRAVRELLQVFAGHVASSRFAVRSASGGPYPLGPCPRETQSPPFVRDEGGPPRYHPCSLLFEKDARSKRYRASPGPAFPPIGLGANSRVVGATGLSPLPVSLLAPRVAVLLSFDAAMTCLSAGSTSL